MSDYRLSVVIPNYNNEKFLKDCINSIENQTYPIEKIIVVDDCSSDSSLEVLDELSKIYSNLQIIPVEKNGKVSHARNTGLSRVDTPYVTFIDADDIYYNNRKIENEMNLIRDYKEKYNKDIISYSSIVFVSPDGSMKPSLKYKNRYYNQGNIFKNILTAKYQFTMMRDFCMPVSCIREVGGYDETSSLYEDLDLILKLSQKNEFYYTGEEGTGYRLTGTGLSSRPIIEHINKKKEIFERNIQDLPNFEKFWCRIMLKFNNYRNKFIIYKLRLFRKLNRLFLSKW